MAHDNTIYSPGSDPTRSTGGRDWNMGDATVKGVKQLSMSEQASDPTNVAGQLQLYTKSDNKLYVIDGDGNADQIQKVGVAGGQTLVAYKTTDESVSSAGTGSTLQDDDELSITIEKNKIYRFRALLWVSTADPTPDIKVGMNGPSAAAVVYTVLAPADTGLATMEHKGTASAWNTTLTCSFVGAVTKVLVIVEGTVEVGASDGTMVVRWAQAVSNANATSVLKGSYLEAVRLA